MAIPWNKGKKDVYSKETLTMMRQAKEGKPLSEKHIENLSKAMIGKNTAGRYGPLNNFFGKHHSLKTKEVLSDLKKGEKSPWFGRHHTKEEIEKIKESRLKQIIPNKNTKIERLVFNELSTRGYGFKTHYPVIGQPDVALPEQKIAIFCDGCYWHGCKEHSKQTDYQIKRQERDRQVTQQLQEQGWLVLRFWEHEINANPIGVVDEIAEVLR